MDSTIWLTTNGGIIELNDNHLTNQKITPITSPFNSTSSSLHFTLDSAKNIWGGTYFGGLQYYNPTTNEHKIFNHSETDNTSLLSDIVWYVYIDSKGSIWAGTQKGISKLNKDFKTFTNISSENSPIENGKTRTIYEDKKGNYWFGTETALYRYRNDTFVKYTHSETDSSSICHNWIVTIDEDQKGNIWFGSYGGGISCYDSTSDNFKSWNTKNGLCNNFTSSIMSDDNNDIWVSTQKGISKLNRDKNTFTSYYKEGGLVDDDFYINSCYKHHDGTVFFGAINGVTYFNPKHIENNNTTSKVALLNLKVQNKEVTPNLHLGFNSHVSHTKNIILQYDYTNFSIEFTSLNHIQSNKNCYSYKLTGYEKIWNEIGNKNEARYTNIPHGQYTFEVKSKNKDSIWSDITSINITILPPFYKTWWFRIISIIIFFTIIYVLYILRVRSIITQKKILETKVIYRTKNLQTKTKEIEIQVKRHNDSLQYAKLIQEASLPSLFGYEKYIKEIDILYIPSQIVSGDLYWINETEENLIIAAIDCTGHGVPGAFLSLIANVALGNIINFRKITSPDLILKELHKSIVKNLRQKQSNNTDGMDMSILSVNKTKKHMSFCGAKNPLLYIQDNELKIIKGDRQSIGGTNMEEDYSFKKHTIDIKSPTTFYLLSDGYCDQFGGEIKGGKKYMFEKFKRTVEKINHLSTKKQTEILKNNHLNWKSTHEQTDDILIIVGKTH